MNTGYPTRIEIGDRASGKTTDMMDEIHDILVQRRGLSPLVVFPHSGYLTWWRDQWTSRFPGVGMPDYVYLHGNSLQRLRGKRVDRVYVEDVDSLAEGIYDERLHEIWPSLINSINPEIIFTVSPIDENQLPYALTPRVDLRNRLAAFKAHKEVSGTP